MAHVDKNPVERCSVAEVLQEVAKPVLALDESAEDALAVAVIDRPEEVAGCVEHQHCGHARVACTAQQH